MQSTRVPNSVCLEIEKIQRDFIWGHVNGHRKVHSINWDTICKDKPYEGLGIKKLSCMNDAFLMKIGWKVIVEPNNLCSQVLRGKYVRNMDLRRGIVVKDDDSLLWKEIGKLWNAIRANMRWVVGCGNETGLTLGLMRVILLLII